MNIYLTGCVGMIVATMTVVIRGLDRASAQSLEAIDADYARRPEAVRTPEERDAVLMVQAMFNASRGV